MENTTDEKTTSVEQPHVTHEVADTTPADPATFLPAGWMYKQRKIGSLTIPWYASPKVQLFMVAMVCFMCPGMYNSLSGLGGGGQLNETAADNSTVALYSTFSVVGFFAGTFTNKMGLRVTLGLGGIGYCIYSSSLLCYTHTTNYGFLYFAGALLGVCAGLLWTAQGTIMMSYPEEGSKGRYISWFWIIFNMGGVIGSLIPLGQNIHTTTSGTVSDGTYIGFIVLMFCGAILALFLCNADKVIRADGSRVVVMKAPTWSSELMGLYETLRYNSYILLLFPMFFASNWFYTYQFNGFNGSHFDVRTRALNSTLYWTSQMFGATLFGYCLDINKFQRTTRAKGALIGLFCLTMIIWGGGYAWQKNALPRSVTSVKGFNGADWTDSSYVGSMFLYMFYGFYDASWQTCIYWFMGALSNSGRKSANFAGFYKGIQSVGAAVIWRIDALGAPYVNEFASCWALQSAALLIAAPVIWYKIKDHVSVEEDLQFSDETLADVLPEGHAEKRIEETV